MPDFSTLKIAFIAGVLSQGGAERQLYYIMKSLQENGADVRLICLTKGDFWERKIRGLGVPIAWVGGVRFKPLKLARIIAFLRKDPPSVLQSQHFYTNLYAVAAARALSLQEIGALRNDAISEVRANGSLYGALSLKAPRVLAANSQSGIRNAINLGIPPSRLRFLPNVVDCDVFRPAPRGEKKTIKLLTAGRLVKQKRFDRFLRTFARIRQESDTEVTGVILGEGPLRQSLEQQARELQLLPNHIDFQDPVSDINDFYGQSNIFVLTSDWEGTPNVVLEAMASGLPVVASRVGGIPDLIQPGKTGFLVNPGDDNSLVSLLLELVDNPNLRFEIGRSGREHVRGNYSLDRLPHFLERLYRSALS